MMCTRISIVSISIAVRCWTAWAEGDDTLEDLVRNTIIHEIGHHFGLTDDDMERLECE